jgi:SAM-dependent methyltransferase
VTQALPANLHLEEVGRYYAGKLRRFGPCALGVDWACELTQQLRFVQLLKLCGLREPFSINDFGCGYGALVPFLEQRHQSRVTAYHGVDIAPEMIAAARMSQPTGNWVQFAVGQELTRMADYSVASGVFNVKLDHSRRSWEAFVRQTLAGLSRWSRRGFAVNFLLPLQASTPQELYCTDPLPWADYCRQVLRREAEVLSGYGLQEFTLIARPPGRREPG